MPKRGDILATEGSCREREAVGAGESPGGAVEVAIMRVDQQFSVLEEDMRLREYPDLGQRDAADEVMLAELERIR